MNDDKTVFKPNIAAQTPVDEDRTVFVAAAREVLAVELVNEQGVVLAQYRFEQAFKVGRAADNAVVVQHETISRNHLEVKPEAGHWYLYNLKSTNGLYLNGQLVQGREVLVFPAQIALGHSGIQLRIQKISAAVVNPVPVIQPETPVQQASNEVTAVYKPGEQSPPARFADETAVPVRSQADIAARLLAKEDTEDMGDYTLMVRRVIRQDQVKRGKSYKKVIWVLAGLFVVAVGLGTYQYMALNKTRQLAIDMFYDIKSLEVNLAQADIKLEQHAEVLDHALQAMSSEKLRAAQEQLKLEQEKIAAEKLRMQDERARLGDMKAKYQQYVQEANTLRLSFPTAKHYEEQLIIKVARELGESELELPEDFVNEVRKYIEYWQSSSRLPKAIGNLEANNYQPIIVDTLKKQGLPLYFIYLPMQESNFDAQAVGPETRFGIAKGAWQLLAGTAQQYGVMPGPLAASRDFDEQDGRFDFAQATQAGVKYLKHIYSTEAQASGLLVMASYNYGDNRVKNMISRMPDNPRDKNFWKFLQQYELPKETRDYVFYIFSAAVIGEDPQHFGFKFNPPLYQVKP